MTFDKHKPWPAPKTVRVYKKSNPYHAAEIAVLPSHLQTNYEIGEYLNNKIPDFSHWCTALSEDKPTIRYDVDEFLTIHPDCNMPTNIENNNPFHPTGNQTVIIDTVRSLMFWIRPIYSDKKYRLICSNYIIHENLILAPPVKTEDFDDIKSAWSTMLEIKRKPHMAFMAVTTPPSYRMFNKATDAQLLMLPAFDHIEYLEKQIAELKPALDAYKRTGWEPCDYNSLSYYKDRAERLGAENKELKSQLISAIKAKEHVDEERTTLIAMLNTNL